MPDFEGPMQFLASLAVGQIVGHHWDEPRPWSPRIVPSVTSTVTPNGPAVTTRLSGDDVG
jgi:hypothetical protein